jgi:hypothetical protein
MVRDIEGILGLISNRVTAPRRFSRQEGFQDRERQDVATEASRDGFTAVLEALLPAKPSPDGTTLMIATPAPA